MAEEEKEDKDPIQETSSTESEGGGGSRTYIIIGAIVLLILLIGGGIAVYFTIGGEKELEFEDFHEEEIGGLQEVEKHKDKKLYFDLDEFIVNLTKVGGQSSFLKIAITLEVLGEEGIVNIQNKLPLIRDSFQTYFRELRADDIQGSAGIYRLRQELLLRVNKTVYPTKVTDVLFRDILVQ